MTQLSLFTDYFEDPEPGSATSGALAKTRSSRPRQKRGGAAAVEAAPKRSRVVRERGKFETLYLPFDDPPVSNSVALPPSDAVVVKATVAALPSTPEKRVSPPVVVDLFSCLVEEEEAPRRIVFDPQVWQLRPESGDFIQIRTGEVREEDEFLPMEGDEVGDGGSEWAVE